MSGSSYVLITYTPNPNNGLTNNVCLYFTYTDSKEPSLKTITGWFLPDKTTSVPTIGDGNYFINDDDLSAYFNKENSPYLNSIFGTYNGQNITTFFMYENKQVQINDDIDNPYTVSYTFSETQCCFSEGTKILCLTEYLMEEYRLVQDLMVGDLVKAYMNDYKPIKTKIQGFLINNPNNRSNCMYIMKKTENNGLIDDLIVTGNHGILLDETDVNEAEQKKNPKWANFKVDDKVNCIAGVSSKFEQITDNELYKYYHFTLDNGDGKKKRFGVWANGVLMETMP